MFEYCTECKSEKNDKTSLKLGGVTIGVNEDVFCASVL